MYIALLGNGAWEINKLKGEQTAKKFRIYCFVRKWGLVIILAINLMLVVFHKYLFQGSYIRIYNVEDGWKVQKNILAKSLRWTVTDTSLSPDQRHLVSLNF